MKKLKCETKFCSKKVKNGKICNTCRTRKWREENKERSSYLNLKHNSKRREIVFKLTYEQFKKFCYKTDYLRGVGKLSISYSIDRINPEKGYIISNLQVLTLSQNAHKGRKFLSFDYQYPEHTRVLSSTYTPSTSNDEDIF